MEILARIPALSVVDPPLPLEPEGVPVAPSSSRRRPTPRSLRFPTNSVMVLALIAAVLWAAAAWREQLRLARHQPAARWAEAFEGAATTPEGVVR